MTNLLHLSASARETGSHSRGYGNRVVTRLHSLYPDTSTTRRDLRKPILAHPSESFVHASLLPANERNDDDLAALALSEELIVEVGEADFIVIDLPMHNFTIPSTLKAWIDHIVRPQRTFTNSPTGKVGLLADRPTFCVMTCGGPVRPEGRSQPNFGSPYLLHILATIGIHNVDFFVADSLSRDDLAVEQTDEAFARWLSSLPPRRTSTVQ